MEWVAPLSTIDSLKDFSNIVIQACGISFSTYVSAIHRFIGLAIWQDPSILPISHNQGTSFKQVLVERNVFMSNQLDCLFWVPTKDDEYSIRLGYLALQHNQFNKTAYHVFEFYWNSSVLSNEGFFSWLALKNQILTSDHLHILNISDPFNYVLYLQVIETKDHLLLNYTFAQDCWHFILNKLNFHMPLPNSLCNLFQAWPILYSKSMFSCLWKCIPTSVVWAIWWERNKIIFNQT